MIASQHSILARQRHLSKKMFCMLHERALPFSNTEQLYVGQFLSTECSTYSLYIRAIQLSKHDTFAMSLLESNKLS